MKTLFTVAAIAALGMALVIGVHILDQRVQVLEHQVRRQEAQTTDVAYYHGGLIRDQQKTLTTLHELLRTLCSRIP